MNNKFKLTLTAIAGFIISINVNAEELSKDVWLGFGVGVSHLENNEIDNEVISTKIELGYNFNNNIGAYISHDYIQDLYIDEVHFAGLGLKGSYDFTENLEVYSKLGALYPIDSNTVSENVSPSVGVGASYALSNSVSANIGFDYIANVEKKSNNSDFDIKQVYLGISYFFGQSPDVITKEVIVEREILVEKEVFVEKNNALPNQSHYITFNLGSSTIDEEGLFKLNELSMLNKSSDDLKLEIVGRTDSSGSDKINKYLSDMRVDAVLKNLSYLGFKKEQIMTDSKSNTDPLYYKDSPVFERSVSVTVIDGTSM